jgi:hypothetical protein
VRFLPDFDPDRARVSSVRRKVTKNHRNFTIERPLNKILVVPTLKIP